MPQPIELVWWGGQRGSWCHGIVEWLTQGFTHRMDVKELQGEGCILVTKADYDSDEERFHEATDKLKWCLQIVTANEEGKRFLSVGIPWDGKGWSGGPNIKLWLQTPHRHQLCDRAGDIRYIPWGWTPNCSVEVQSKKDLDCSFAGQVTHRRRWELMEAFTDIAVINKKWEFHGSDGFAKGISQQEYYTLLGRSKVVPCPSGPYTVDSFRVCEALNLGAVPLLDGSSPKGPYPEYWQRVFGADCPLSVVNEWDELLVRLEGILSTWSVGQTVVSVWWQRWKANLQAQLMADLHELGAL